MTTSDYIIPHDSFPTLKLIFLGDHSVGKTHLLKKFIADATSSSSNNYSTLYVPTSGIDIYKVEMNSGRLKKEIYLSLWDVSYKEVEGTHKNYILNHADAIVYVVDLVSYRSLEYVDLWYEIIAKKLYSNDKNFKPSLFLMLNKKDLLRPINKTSHDNKRTSISINSSPPVNNTSSSNPFSFFSSFINSMSPSQNESPTNKPIINQPLPNSSLPFTSNYFANLPINKNIPTTRHSSISSTPISSPPPTIIEIDDKPDYDTYGSLLTPSLLDAYIQKAGIKCWLFTSAKSGHTVLDAINSIIAIVLKVEKTIDQEIHNEEYTGLLTNSLIDVPVYETDLHYLTDFSDTKAIKQIKLLIDNIKRYEKKLNIYLELPNLDNELETMSSNELISYITNYKAILSELQILSNVQ